MLRISLSLESNLLRIALNSQAAITTATQLYVEPARSWVELRVQKAMAVALCTLMWVKGHSGVKGNEDADRKANLKAYGSKVVGRADVITPAGIRQDFPIHTKPKHPRWTRKALKGLVYITIDRGPLRRLLKIIGKREDYRCEYGEIQNAVHLRRCQRWEMAREEAWRIWNGARR